MQQYTDGVVHVVLSLSSPVYQVEMLCDLYTGFGPAN